AIHKGSLVSIFEFSAGMIHERHSLAYFTRDQQGEDQRGHYVRIRSRYLDDEMKKILDCAMRAARLAGESIVSARRRADFSVQFKGELNLVTSADLKAERIILETIRKEFPTHEFLAEESAPLLNSKEDYRKDLWVIDPIDGTTNFAHGHP